MNGGRESFRSLANENEVYPILFSWWPYKWCKINIRKGFRFVFKSLLGSRRTKWYNLDGWKNIAQSETCNGEVGGGRKRDRLFFPHFWEKQVKNIQITLILVKKGKRCVGCCVLIFFSNFVDLCEDYEGVLVMIQKIYFLT